jgi:hypothetical protein
MNLPVQTPPPLRFVFVYFWVVAIAVTAVNYIKARHRLNAAMLSPDRIADGQRYLRTFAIMSAMPWAVMGLGQQLGQTPTVLHYFRPQDDNPFVFAWIGVIFLQACVHAWWVLAADGAGKLAGLWSAMGFGVPPTWVIKLVAGAGPFFVLFWAGLLSMIDVPIPP